MSTPQRPKIVTVRVSSGSGPTSRMTPNLMYGASAAALAIGRMGRDAYSIVRTKAIMGVTRQEQVLPGLLEPLKSAIERRDAAASASSAEERQVTALEAEFTGQEIHWQAIMRVGTAVEGLIAMIAGLEAYRSKSGDPADPLLRHDLDLLRVLQEKRRRKLGYWEALSSRPDPALIVAAGFSAPEVQAFLSANRRWAINTKEQFASIRHYYTPALHAVYAKYKHGYTLVSPQVSPLEFEQEGTAPQLANEAFRRGAFGVMHQDPNGRRVVHVVESNDDELRSSLTTAATALRLTKGLATTWLLEAEHPSERTIAFSGLDRGLLLRWLSGLEDVYDFASVLTPGTPSAPEEVLGS